MQDHLVIFTLTVYLGCQCQKFIILCHITLEDHSAGEFEETSKFDSFIAKLLDDAHCLAEHPAGDQDFQKHFAVCFDIFAIVQSAQIAVQICSVHMTCIKIQDLFSHRIPVFLSTFFCFCQFLEIFQIFSIQFMTLTVMQKDTCIIHTALQDPLQRITFIHQFFDIIMYRGCIAALFVVAEQKNSIFCIDPWICNTLHTWINLLRGKLTVADDHFPDLSVITVKTIGKKFP